MDAVEFFTRNKFLNRSQRLEALTPNFKETI